MTIVAAVFTGLAALVHVYIFVLESLRWRQPATWKIFGLASQADADTTAPRDAGLGRDDPPQDPLDREPPAAPQHL